ncbi:MAG: type II toxin-antitoxin system VapC family toxin [Kiritimatiellae bacterium]|nr:type II toxin-antitoxin system VapC family toxin [Kiritimatiellia bacterium]
MIYWDTSCVLKLYAPEEDSELYLNLADSTTEPFFSSEILNTELFYAFCQKELRGDIKQGWAELLHKKFCADVDGGRFVLLTVGRDILVQSNEVARRCYAHKPPVLLRTLDGIHLATTLVAKCTEIVTTDQRMQQAAQILGVSVY